MLRHVIQFLVELEGHRDAQDVAECVLVYKLIVMATVDGQVLHTPQIEDDLLAGETIVLVETELLAVTQLLLDDRLLL